MFSLDDVIRAMKDKGYRIDTRPDALNVVGIRSADPSSQDKFDDYIAYFTFDAKGNPKGKVATGTTDPSTYYLQSPMNPEGTAILKSGQYVDAYAIGKHRGKYEALVQTKPVTVIRDNDRNGYTNLFDRTTTGLYGINIHRSTATKSDDTLIGKDSAGCQVFQYVNDYNDMMRMAKTHESKYGNRFTYTLLDERDTIKNVNTVLAVGIIGLASLSAAYAAYKLIK